MYIVIELQTNNGKTANIVNAYDDLNTTYNKFHTILAAAAVSSVEVHTAVILNEVGNTIASGHFAHAKEESEE